MRLHRCAIRTISGDADISTLDVCHRARQDLDVTSCVRVARRCTVIPARQQAADGRAATDQLVASAHWCDVIDVDGRRMPKVADRWRGRYDRRAGLPLNALTTRRRIQQQPLKQQ